MADQELQPDATDQPRRATLAWLGHPWVLLTIGIVILLGGWVGAGVVAEARRQDAVYRLEREGRVDLNSFLGCGLSPTIGRLPAWLPEFVGDRLPLSWQSRSPEFTGCRFLGRATDADVALVNRIPEIRIIEFEDAGGLSEASLINSIASHDLYMLSFEAPYRPTAAQYTALTEKGILLNLSTLAGPFDQHAIDSISRLQGLDYLTLEGPATAANLGGLTKHSFARSIEWHHSQLTDEQFAQLHGSGRFASLDLKATRLTAKSWPLLSSINAASLSLESPHITDETLRYLARNEELSGINLSGGAITDQGIAELSSASKLGHLQLDTATGLSLASARSLSSMPTLRSITLLDASDVTDEWLTELTRLELGSLDLNHSQVTDAGVAALANQKELFRISLAGSRVTDACLSTLAMLQPDYADLRSTAITDSGLLHYWMLAGPDADIRLHVAGTPITKAGVDEFLKRCPSAMIIGVPGCEPDANHYWFIPLKRKTTALTKSSELVSLSQDTP